MDMHARNEYLKVIKERYQRAKKRREKSEILDEYCENTGQVRKYAIRRINSVTGSAKPRRKKQEIYGAEVKAALAKVWEVFDYPCGQRLKPLLEGEIDRLRKLGELAVSDECALKLKKISSATIDRKLKHQRETLYITRVKGHPRPSYFLQQKIPIKLTEWDTSKVGYVEADLVVHCGSSTLGEYVNTLSVTEIGSGWWEGQAIMGKSQGRTFEALKEVRRRTPFEWKGVDSDNGQEFINDLLYRYCVAGGLEFTRSRPYKKNDNAYIEQKNWTHVRKVLGYPRYDTLDELVIINELYSGSLRLYKNFFQPVMKLVSKVRIGGRVKRKYDIPKSPYRRLVESGVLSAKARKELDSLYLKLNPAQLKRDIEYRLETLCQAYERKRGTHHSDPHKKRSPRSVTFFMMQPEPVGLPG